MFRGNPEFDFGEWNRLVRDLAEWREERYAIVAGWSVREALLADLERVRQKERDAYERECDRYMHGRQAQDAPKVPEILASDDAFLYGPLTDGHERERS